MGDRKGGNGRKKEQEWEEERRGMKVSKMKDGRKEEAGRQEGRDGMAAPLHYKIGAHSFALSSFCSTFARDKRHAAI